MRIALVGFGYIGFPLALELAKNYIRTMGLDLNKAKLLLATTPEGSMEELFNVSYSGTTSLTQIYWMVAKRLEALHQNLVCGDPPCVPLRYRYIQHSQAGHSETKVQLDHEPTRSVAKGLDELVPWFASLPPQS